MTIGYVLKIIIIIFALKKDLKKKKKIPVGIKTLKLVIYFVSYSN